MNKCSINSSFWYWFYLVTFHTYFLTVLLREVNSYWYPFHENILRIYSDTLSKIIPEYIYTLNENIHRIPLSLHLRPHASYVYKTHVTHSRKFKQQKVKVYKSWVNKGNSKQYTHSVSDTCRNMSTNFNHIYIYIYTYTDVVQMHTCSIITKQLA